LTSFAFFVLVVAAVVRKRLVAKAFHSNFKPPVSVLKPVHGMEPRLEESLESFFQQDYPDYELIFCARHAHDPALLLAERLSARYPDVKVKILTCGEPKWPNAKVYSLSRMMEAADNELIVISDSDVKVTPEYLARIVAPLEDERVGLVTCVYRGVSVRGFWSKLEALGMSVEMTSGVLVAEMLEGMKFALGPTMVTRKSCVREVGGFEAFGDYCADDYVLGNLIEKQGHRVVLSDHAVDHIVLHRSFMESLKHQVRWMRSTRFSRPKGHVGTVLTFAMPFGVLSLIAGILGHHALLGTAIFAATCVERMAQSVITGYGIVGDKESLKQAWLFPLRDLLGFFLWCGSYASSKIDWRAEVYQLTNGGRMLRVSEDAAITRLASSSETPN
jgi:ceramide glucosyltransferase